MIKRHEFYAMMAVLFIFMLFSVASAVSYQPQIIQPTKPYHAIKVESDLAQNTYVTVLDTVTGSGALNYVTINSTTRDNGAYNIKATIDGTEYVLSTSGQNMASAGIYSYVSSTAYANSKTLIYNGPIYFKTSLKVEIRHTNATASTLESVVHYALE